MDCSDKLDELSTEPVIQDVIKFTGLGNYDGKLAFIYGRMYGNSRPSELLIGATKISGNFKNNNFSFKGVKITNGKVNIPLYLAYDGEFYTGNYQAYSVFNPYSVRIYISTNDTMKWFYGLSMENIIATGTLPRLGYPRWGELPIYDKSDFNDWTDFDY